MKAKVLTLLLLFILAIIACTPGESIPQISPQQQSTSAGKQEVTSSAKAGWEEEWNRAPGKYSSGICSLARFYYLRNPG